jgi:hypothetical protein
MGDKDFFLQNELSALFFFFFFFFFSYFFLHSFHFSAATIYKNKRHLFTKVSSRTTHLASQQTHIFTYYKLEFNKHINL